MRDQADKLRQVIDNLKNKQPTDDSVSPIKHQKRSARVITITSGKGGVGKTNITVNLAIALSEQGYRVVILDADFGLANIDVLFGIMPRFSLVDVIKNQRSILEILAEGPKNTRFISGGSGVEELIKLNNVQLLKFVEDISLLDKIADIILVDTGAGLSENVMSFVLAADEVLLVTTPEPTSITDAYALIKMVSNRDKTKSIRLIINRTDNINEANDITNKLMLVADKFLGMKILPIGYILSDESVMKAVKKQQPFILSFPNSQATKCVKEISNNLSKEDKKIQVASNVGFRGFVSRLVEFIKA